AWSGAHPPRERHLRAAGGVNRLWALLVALCAAGFVLASPFFLNAIDASHPPISPAAVLALQGGQALLLCALAAYAGIRFAPRAGLDAPWLRSFAERRETPPAFGSVAIEAAAVGSVTAIVVTAVAFARIPMTGGVVAHVLLGNGIAGVVFGWMFRRRGLEGAMVAHGAADVWLQAALPALLA